MTSRSVSLLCQQLAIALIQPQRRQVLFVHHDDELIAALDEDDIRLDQPRLGAVVALAGPRVEPADEVDRLLRMLLWLADSACQPASGRASAAATNVGR